MVYAGKEAKMILKELTCVIFGHQWNESGSSTCLRHDFNVEFGHHRICSRCHLQQNLTTRYCPTCYDEFNDKLRRIAGPGVLCGAPKGLLRVDIKKHGPAHKSVRPCPGEDVNVIL